MIKMEDTDMWSLRVTATGTLISRLPYCDVVLMLYVCINKRWGDGRTGVE
jgi:hypothetical protein